MKSAMMVTSLAGIAMLGVLSGELLFPHQAIAGHCFHANYHHNGSLFILSSCSDLPLTLSYARPHTALARHGVRVGTEIFIGREDLDGSLAGTAWVYKRNCGKMGFIVHGRLNHKNLVLRGDVPVRNKDCAVVSARRSKLIFTPAPGRGPAVAGFQRSFGELRINQPDNEQAVRDVSPINQPLRQPSFSCSGRLSHVERTICNNGLLADLDTRMAKYFNQLVARLGESSRKRLIREQRRWLSKRRNRCGSDRRCLEIEYLERTATLEDWPLAGRP